jgi:methionyl-tRNA synthetase
MARRVLVTSALPYSNGRPHVGHVAGAYLPADIYVRYLRLSGAEVRFVSGSDDYGVAIMLTADREKKTAAEVAAYYNERQRVAFEGLNIAFDIYSGTSRSPYHIPLAQDFFLKIQKKGYFEKIESPQFYDSTRQIFLPDRYVKGSCGYCGTADQNGDQCEQCGNILDTEKLLNPVSAFTGKPAEVRRTSHWFLDLSRCRSQVEEWLSKAVLRENTRTYVRGLLGEGLVKRAMTRDISWGIPVPLDEPDAKGKVLYVWFDAPIGYISFTKELCAARDQDAERYQEWWRSKDTEIYHFIGEDNTIFHTVIWIAMLSLAGEYELPRGVIVNNFLNFQRAGEEAEKMSKSRGTAVWIEDYVSAGGSADAMRYYLTAIAPERARGVYKPDDFEARYNGELADVLGNLVHRVISFSRKYFGPVIPQYPEAKVAQVDHDFVTLIEKTHNQVTEKLEGFEFREALFLVMELARASNRYLDQKAPWTSRKSDLELTAVTMSYALRAIKALGILLLPFLPGSASRILAFLGIEANRASWTDVVKAPRGGEALQEPLVLFPKHEVKTA